MERAPSVCLQRATPSILTCLHKWALVRKMTWQIVNPMLPPRPLSSPLALVYFVRVHIDSANTLQRAHVRSLFSSTAQGALHTCSMPKGSLVLQVLVSMPAHTRACMRARTHVRQRASTEDAHKGSKALPQPRALAPEAELGKGTSQLAAPLCAIP